MKNGYDFFSIFRDVANSRQPKSENVKRDDEDEKGNSKKNTTKEE